MQKNLCLVKRCLVFLMIVMILPIISMITALAASTTITYDMTPLENKTTSNITLTKGNNFKYSNTWTRVVTDAETGYYFQINLQKRNLLFFWVSESNINYLDPRAGVTVTANFGNSLGKSTIRYKLYNYGTYRISGNLVSYDN